MVVDGRLSRRVWAEGRATRVYGTRGPRLLPLTGILVAIFANSLLGVKRAAGRLETVSFDNIDREPAGRLHAEGFFNTVLFTGMGVE